MAASSSRRPTTRTDSLESVVIARDVKGDPLPETPKVVFPPSAVAWHCQAALAVIQALFCIGSVYLKSQLMSLSTADARSFHPIVYAFAREAIAGPIMCAIAYAQSALLPKKQDLLAIAGLGACLYLNQLCYIVGIDLSGVLVATCMQPAIPVFTAMLAVLLRIELGSWQKAAGIAAAVTGSVCMVLGGTTSHAEGDRWQLMLGNACLLLNTLSMAVYYLAVKQLVQKYPAMCVAAWAYITAAVLMGITAALAIPLANFEVPRPLWGPLAYWIVICSVLGYYIVTWATQHLAASQVAAFQCLQPLLGSVLAITLLGEEPSLWDLGAIGVIGGLAAVSLDKMSAKPVPADYLPGKGLTQKLSKPATLGPSISLTSKSRP